MERAREIALVDLGNKATLALWQRMSGHPHRATQENHEIFSWRQSRVISRKTIRPWRRPHAVQWTVFTICVNHKRLCSTHYREYARVSLKTLQHWDRRNSRARITHWPLGSLINTRINAKIGGPIRSRFQIKAVVRRLPVKMIWVWTWRLSSLEYLPLSFRTVTASESSLSLSRFFSRSAFDHFHKLTIQLTN